MLDELLPYYEQEISHLRFLGREFAREYPKIAARLQLEGDHCEDPHTERLVESFAFLSARVHKKLDDDLPEIVEAFLDVLYPHYLRPTPSLSIAQLDPGEQTSLTGRYQVARHTEMFSRPVEGVACRFRTCYPVDVWPLRVESAGFSLLERSAFNGRDKDSVARLDLAFEALNDQSVGSFGIDRLRLFLDGEGALMHPMYELLFNNLTRLSVSFDEGGQRREVALPTDSLTPVGFAPEEGLIDYPERSFLGYRLLHEYFTFPDKFMFFDVEGLTRLLARASGTRFELHFHFADYALDERLSRLSQSLGRNHFRLGCTPVINLFERQAEPILLTHTQAEYPVVADVRNPHGAEVISIDRVTRVQKTAERDHVRYCPPFFEPQGSAPSRETSYWLSRRVPSARERDAGTELLLRLADRELNAIDATSDVLSLKLTCSNRDLPQRLSFGHPRGDFTLPREQVVKAIRCLRKPTPSARPPMGKGVIWRLISHLSLNHLSLVERGRDVLLEMLSLYNYRDLEATRRQINGIASIQSAPAMTRIGHPRPAFVRGTGITLELDEQEFIGSGIFVFGMVLDHFFGQYCSLNSFTRLTLRSRQREKDVVTWPARTGTQPLV
ncbi:type VI secretion system baseplate subunit TssF [Cobetia marina]|jgi:type VI secretion system protein ImpG|uniref:Type VI secretion system baseplate subunit TssF n=1 Tax=Cobetia marina TaxID=28258 RepID=A0ABU9GDZ8_COBMA|nr:MULTISPECIES: type VI secretion system baseplate subunit TssF [Cobetia]AOM01653.1 type VI secretion system protein [Cobetia marina]AZV31551.1 type VI secretion system baseplate subunit TssF [Cobetia sp. ICG0124]MDH2291456.1 type VI secretion system baseplate subunit TssF [Cobetia sp. 10Alg 146]MDH2375420.1 type VI secretion system baseplate subunit TssF [Cobetia sp. 3AK]MDI6005281.1 type VI secretion system baseplate subunit TssF [Cobetia pacifica]